MTSRTNTATLPRLLFTIASHQFNFLFSHCLIRTNENVSNTSFWVSNVYNQDPQFRDVENYDLRFWSTSPARDIGDALIGTSVLFDLNGNSRMADAMPDAGAYEYQP
jgi:hypothetical protein